MRKYLIALLALATLVVCCKKKGIDSGNGSSTGSSEFSYMLKSDSVISVYSNSTYYLSFSLAVTKGVITANPVTCTLEGLPDNVRITPPKIVVGNLLGGLFQLDIGTLSYGDYPFYIVHQSDKYGTQKQKVILRITAPPDYAALLAGTYDSSYDFCPDSGFFNYTSVVSTVPDTAYLAKISNIRALGSDFVVRAWIQNTITIPVQTVKGRTIWGSGTYAQDARSGHGGDYVMSINDTIVTGADTLGCTIHIEH
ncbi:MAG: hypothetical protein KF744_15370 [Taibaiella sp.]|nr:hypothetical protein [Taibaiella sp.]